jgi:hypothetical protein
VASTSDQFICSTMRPTSNAFSSSSSHVSVASIDMAVDFH